MEQPLGTVTWEDPTSHHAGNAPALSGSSKNQIPHRVEGPGVTDVARADATIGRHTIARSKIDSGASRCRKAPACPVALGESRTPNRLIRSQVLYPLSYERNLRRPTV